ncbi:hypothetical protein HH310_15650 [Actinoplanes sp. TBRC 11911]|uniref:hypothetical protein n=1 Tax=Actinoplanes sp. TBRC 11911 TaxID=2729386 RepID=UPI00145E2B15|nr:hypothetical protein [Actinoplanes sp. TBRC 11911]NMO52624.1 hypothetical protein [Actinoplanes sp. TBRC 11911]
MSAGQALFRFYRPFIIGFSGVVVALEVAALVIAAVNGKLNYSTWLLFTGTGVRWWLLVVGTVLVALQLKVFVSNGVTRREFVRGAARFMLALAVGWAAVLALGHGLESYVMGLLDQRGSNYPVATASQMLSDFGHALPGLIAYPLSGAVIAVGFYRFRTWIGVGVMVLGAVPVVVGDYLLRINGNGHVTHQGPYVLALLGSLAISGVAAVAFLRLMSDVPIRRTAG